MSVPLTEIMQEEDLLRAEDRSLHRAEPPTAVPGYQPERLLGKGAFGEVWLARNSNTGCKVAIKFYAHRADWALMAREVDKLRHLATDRYVVQLEQVGWEAKPPYYVMEFIEQGSLEERLRNGPLPVSDTIELFREIVVGLSHAHAKGILHCDLKPANILMGDDQKPRLADFGQSRLSHEQSPALGTLFYMAPEQANLRAAPDAAWDVYALGALLYRMLTGELPYYAKERVTEIRQAGNLEARLARYTRFIEESPVPTAHRRVGGVDRKLADIVDRCLARKPAHRYPSLGALLAALNERALQRARRPLLLLGVVGPLLSFVIIVLLAVWAAHGAVEESAQALIQRAEKDDSYSAHNMAHLIALQIDRNWRMLEREVESEELQRLLPGISGRFDQDFATAVANPDKETRNAEQVRKWYADLQRLRLQSWLQRAVQRQRGAAGERAWWLLSPKGRQIAYVHRLDPGENDKYLGWDCAYRDYFHGKGMDQQPGSLGLSPVEGIHLSRVYRSRTQGDWEVAFSAPVRRNAAPGGPIVGVLVMAVKLDRFELAAGDEQWSVIFDSNPNIERVDGKLLPLPAAIIFHPLFDKVRRALESSAPPRHMDSAVAELVREWSKLKRHCTLEAMQAADGMNPARQPSTAHELLAELKNTGATERLSFRNGLCIKDYCDPVSDEEASWVATIDAVVVHRGKDLAIETGWGVVVQERAEGIAKPVESLRTKLRFQGIVAVLLLGAVLLSAWGFVLLLFWDSSKSRLAGFLRRRAGLGTASLSSRSGALGSQGPSETSGLRAPQLPGGGNGSAHQSVPTAPSMSSGKLQSSVGPAGPHHAAREQTAAANRGDATNGSANR